MGWESSDMVKLSAGYLHLEETFSGSEISLILKNKMAATGISFKIIYLFLLAGSDR